MEPPSLLSQQHSYALMHQQQQQSHQQPHQQAHHHHHQQQQPPLQQLQQQPQAPGIYDPQQQQGGGQSGQGTLLPPSNSVMNSNPSSNSTIGHKRDFSGQAVNANSHQDSQDGGNFVKLFVGSVPRTITEEEVRPMFAEHGNVLEVALIKDKRTGQQQGCCFIKYGTIEEAERAIRALNNQRTLPGGTAPVQVRYADGERERLGAVEHKLFVGSLNKQASEKEIQELFSPYGRVDDVYIMRDEQKQSRGCAFIKYPTREMATAAITALNGIYIMLGCDQPLAVRFADPKRPKGGDTRVGGPGFGGPGFNSRPGNVGNRLVPAPMGQMGGRGPPMGWRPMGGPGMGPQAQMGPGAYGGSMGPRGVPVNASMGGPLSAPNMNGHPQVSMPVPSQMVGPGMLPPAQQQGYYQQGAQRQPQSYGQQASPQQQPYGQLSASQPQPQPQQQSSQQLLSLQSQQPLPLPQGQGASQQQHLQQLQPPQQQLQPAQQHLQTQQQLQQQPQSLLQPQSQQPLQQQTQPQQQPLQQQQTYYQVPAMQQAQQQPSWLLPVQPQTIASLPPPPALPTTCEWSEHTSPEGYKYYYNSSSGESKWEKPEELLVFEQQQQVSQIQQQPVSTPQYSGPAVISQQHPIQGLNYGQAQPTNGSADQPRQQGPPGANLFVFRIPDDFTDETLKETFGPFGNVVSARVGVERESGRNRGFGFVSFDNASSAESAIQGLNNVLIGGRRLKVERKRGEENGVQSFQSY